MASSGTVCGDCGAALSEKDRECPQCGAVNLGGGRAACAQCGHRNLNEGAFCEACGARLPDAGGGTAEGEPAAHRGEEDKPRRKKQRRFEPWHVVAGTGVLILTAVLVYLEVSRVQSPARPHVHDNISSETAGVIREIERLQQSIEANPEDQASILRLANLLHDHSMQDPRLIFRAIETYQRYLKLNPADPDARVDLGICYFEMARVDSVHTGELLAIAIREMETVHQAVPSHQPAVFNLGIVNLFAGDLESSSKWFRKAVEVNAGTELGRRAQRLLEQHMFESEN